MRHVRDDGDELVVPVGPERHDVGPERGDDRLNGREARRRRLGGRGEHPRCPDEEVGVGTVRPLLFRAGQRVPHDEKRGSGRAATIAPFTPATSVTVPAVEPSSSSATSTTADAGVATNEMSDNPSKPTSSTTPISRARRARPVEIRPGDVPTSPAKRTGDRRPDETEAHDRARGGVAGSS